MDPAITNGFGFVSAFAMFLFAITWRRRYGTVQLRTEFYEFTVMNRARLCEEEEGERRQGPNKERLGCLRKYRVHMIANQLEYTDDKAMKHKNAKIDLTK